MRAQIINYQLKNIGQDEPFYLKKETIMTKTRSTLLLTLAIAWTGLSHADKLQFPTHVPVQDLKWFATGIGPIQAAIAYGDMTKGPYGVFLKFPGDFASPMHHHTGDYRAVVIGGTIVNSEVGEADITMEPGSHWYQRGNVSHVTKCVSADGCTVFLTQKGKFDFLSKKTR